MHNISILIDPNIQSLRHWGGQLKGQWRRAFERKYGNLLGLVNIEVQPAALSALTQYYDLPLKCFTFRDFQLTPTLEEYERLIGIPYDKSPPYLFKGNYPSWASLARVLKAEEKSEWSGRDPKSCLGRKAPAASRGRRLAGLCRHQEDEVPHRRPLFELCQALDEGMIDCTPGRGHREINLVVPQWNERGDMINCYGGFPNVPLMGTQGAINCNPELTLYQAGYPMVLPPSEEAMMLFILHGGRALEEDSSSLEKDHQKGPRVGTTELRSLVQLQVLAVAQKRKWKELDSREGRESQETPEVERWFRIAA
ncbi:hypothetical protein CR513_24763, partial [Mucuna pruriens]